MINVVYKESETKKFGFFLYFSHLISVLFSEFLDEVSIDAVNKFNKMDMKVAPSLFLEFTGSPSSLDEQASVVGKYMLKNHNVKKLNCFGFFYN